MRIHPRDFLLRDALRRAKGWEKVLQHVERCVKCRERAFVLGSAGSLRGRSETPDYGPAIERSFRTLESLQAMLGKERGAAPGLLARLLKLPKGQQQLLIRNSSRFQTWGLFELLIQVGREETFTDPTHAEEILQLALDVSSCLDDSFYGKERIEDLRARTWGFIGNARRVKIELTAAEEAFDEALQRLRSGTEDPLERAVLFDLKASLRREQQRPKEALRFSHRAIKIFHRAGESHLMGRSLVNVAVVHQALGDFKEMLALLRRSIELLDPVREPRVALCAVHNLIDGLTAAGNLMEAQKILSHSRPLYQQFWEPRVQCRQMWTEAKLLAALGHYGEAEELLTTARDGFAGVGAVEESHRISRDLSVIAAKAGGTP